jgi:O-antigen/teichoic acid export membrane protein
VIDKLVITNGAYLVAAKVVKLICNLILAASLARYLGVVEFGTYGILLSIYYVLYVLSEFGLRSLLIKNFSQGKKDENRYIQAGLAIRFPGSILIALGCFVILIFFPEDDLTRMTAVMALALILKPAEVIAWWLDGHFKTHIWAKFDVLVTVMFLGVKLWVIQLGWSLFQITCLISLEAMFLPFFLIWILLLTNRKALTRKMFDYELCRKIFTTAMPAMLSGISVIIFMRTDQFMVGYYGYQEGLGFLVASNNLNMLFLVGFHTIATALFPFLSKLRAKNLNDYNLAIKFVSFGFFWLGSLLICLVYLFSEEIILFLYGDAFRPSVAMLEAQIIIVIFAAFSLIRHNILVNSGAQKYEFYIDLAGALINVLLNMILIVKLGAIGAIYASVTTYIVMTLSIPLCFKETRHTVILFLSSPYSIFTKGSFKKTL